MTNYTWLAKDQSGKKIVKEVEAETVEDAKFILLATGYTELELTGNEISAAVLAGFTHKKFLGQEIRSTAEQRQRSRENPTVSFADVVLKGINRSKRLFFFNIIDWNLQQLLRQLDFNSPPDSWGFTMAGISCLHRLAFSLLQKVNPGRRLAKMGRGFVTD